MCHDPLHRTSDVQHTRSDTFIFSVYLLQPWVPETPADAMHGEVSLVRCTFTLMDGTDNSNHLRALVSETDRDSVLLKGCDKYMSGIASKEGRLTSYRDDLQRGTSSVAYTKRPGVGTRQHVVRTSRAKRPPCRVQTSLRQVPEKHS